MDKCKRCVWGTWVTLQQIFCMFPECVRLDRTEKNNAKKASKAMSTPRLPQPNTCKVLSATSKAGV